jgi:UDP:flavonoid glycosyltransferase YjiC (YdhE family)
MSATRVLLGWELGGGQGHVQRLVSLATKLELNGFEPIFALKSYNIKGMSFPGRIVLAPRLPFLGRRESYTFADILENFGFGNVNLLRSHLQAWQSVLEEVKPRLIIADHAPGLVLAARGVPTVVVGECFTVPPPVEVFPQLVFPAPPESTQRQELVSKTVREMMQIDVSLGELLNGDMSFIFGIPELDPYRHLRSCSQYVSLHTTPIPPNLHSDDGPAWAYLSDNYPHRDLIRQTLRSEFNFKSLAEVLAGKSLAIHHGGLTTSITCLLAGIPQLVLPMHLEQRLNAVALSQLGVATTVTQLTWSSLLASQTQVYELTGAAKIRAQNLAYWNQSFMDVVLKSCFELMQP